MTYDTIFGRPYPSASPPGELMADFRARIAQEQAQAAERRQAELAEQVSTQYTARERIRIWERLHGLTLPRDPSARLMGIVAADTALALDQVIEERERRRAARCTASPSTAIVQTITALEGRSVTTETASPAK